MNSLQHSDTPQLEKDPQQFVDARLSDFDRYGAPYHVHFDGESEGAMLNPEGAEHNLDAAVLLTKFIRMRHTTDRSASGDVQMEWFSDKYPASDVKPDALRKPTNVVRLWLLKLGPHNDMSDAEYDLSEAREWMIDEYERKIEKGGHGDQEGRLVANLDLELAELSEGEDRLIYLMDAVEYLKKSKQSYIESGEYGKAVLEQAVISSIKIELARQEILGERQLLDEVDEDKSEQLEDVAHNELDVLFEEIPVALGQISSAFQEMTNDEAKGDLGRKKLKNLALLFEAVAYYSLLEKITHEGTISSAKVGLGLLRQERGTTNKIFTEEGPSENAGFNFNYDIILTQLNPDRHSLGEGLYVTTYIQNKLAEEDAPHEKAALVSKRFFKNKEFQFVTPRAMTDIDPASGDMELRDEAIHFAEKLKSVVKTDDD